MGCNPFSITSQGWHISQFQSDTIARSYIISTLEESIQTVNSAIHLLLMERTSILLIYYFIYFLDNLYCPQTCLESLNLKQELHADLQSLGSMNLLANKQLE